MIDVWQPIKTAPRIEFARYLGFDEVTAELFGSREAGLCLITWLDGDDDDEPGDWQVQPFAEGMDCIESEHRVTLWMPLTAIVPPLSSGERA